MMNTEKFNLTWNDFANCTSDSFKALLGQEDFVDVTLVSEDGEQIKAHKVVLSASSPILKNILIRNCHQHPLIFLAGVKYQELKALVDFMYLGQVEVFQEDLGVLMTAADILKVKGLYKDKKPEDFNNEVVVDTHEVEQNIYGDDYLMEGEGIKSNILTAIDTTPNKEEQEVSFSSNIVFPTETPFSKVEKEFHCEECNYRTKYKHHLVAHIKAKHRGVKFPCNVCNFKSSFAHNLSTHKRTMHGTI